MKLLINIIACACLLATAPSQAIPTLLKLSLADGAGNSVYVTDQGLGDNNPDLGAITYFGSLGGFDLNLTTGLSAPQLGSSIDPILQLTSIDIGTFAGGTLTIGLSANEFYGPIGDALFSLDAGGTTTGSLDLDFFLDTSNTHFETEQLLAALSVGPGGFLETVTNNVSISDVDVPFSVSLFSTITHTGPGFTVFQATGKDPPPVPLPEPATLALLGIGLLGLGVTRKRIKS